MTVDLSTILCGVELPTPVLTASGCSNNGLELAPFVDLAAIGAVVTKSVMSRPRSGRPTPRMAETPSGMLNSIGLQGPGIDQFLDKDLPALLDRGARAVVSIAGGSVAEYVEVARKVAGAPGVSMIEVNISCPNVEHRGEVFACDPGQAAAVVGAVKRSSNVPVLAKLSPDVTSIVEIAESVVQAGADGLSLINTLLGLAIDKDTLLPVLGGITGGLSGPAIAPVALRCVWQVHQAMPDVPILGMGGIRTGADALAFIAAGAIAVSVGTATFGDPSSPRRIAQELAGELARLGFTSPADAVGRSASEDFVTRAPIAVALDAPDLETAARWAEAVMPYVSTVKVGLELFCRYGPDVVSAVRGGAGVSVFLDLKLHDIPNTVAAAAKAAAYLKPDILTVHASGGPDMVTAAVQGAPDARIAAVTILTSLSESDLARIGITGPPLDAVRRLAVLSVQAGARALVCSPQEVAAVRAEVGPEILLITPGVRPVGAETQDQARIATPAQALADGADLLVIGRPITAAASPGSAAAAIAAALSG